MFMDKEDTENLVEDLVLGLYVFIAIPSSIFLFYHMVL